uniref:Glycoside hydrolase family 28 n=1 Tax=Extatosoma tiaratum TaxID=7024 RepID=A0A191XSZ7_EXTTI|nr:glycoside hydrolase family 28 [Extatosoma tiaratum]
MRKQLVCFFTAFTFLVLLNGGTARDLRNVTEPKTPETCTTLKPSVKDETKNIQKALDTCSKGKAVALSSGIFYSGPLSIPSGVSLLVEKNATLAAFPTPELYDRGANTCGTIDDIGEGCKPFITISGANGSGIYGKGVINGLGGTKMTGRNISWWRLAREATKVHKLQNNPKLIRIENSTDITLYQITLRDSPFYHVESFLTFGFTVWGITIIAPANALNNDGIDPTGSMNVTIAHCNISTGDDNIAISALYAPARHISVTNNYLSHGNSMGIGAGAIYGVSEVTVTNLTLNNIRHGLYIATSTLNGGLVTNITYNNVCIKNSKWPINLDTNYYHQKGNYTPQFTNIAFNNIRVVTNGTFLIHGVSKSVPITASFNNVHISKGSVWTVRNAVVKGTWEEDADGNSCGIAGNV